MSSKIDASVSVTDEEARLANLPGADNYRPSHQIYKDEINRDAAVVMLNNEAYRAFKDTVLFSQYPELKAEMQSVAFGVVLYKRLENINLENFKIATGFELHLKARLLSKDWVVQRIKESGPFKLLASDQRSRPIAKRELLSIEAYQYDGENQQNKLLGLMKESLSFNLILNKPAYRTELGIGDEMVAVIEEFRLLRNQIHFPGDPVESPQLNQYHGEQLMRMLIAFINSEIVVPTNSLVKRHDLNINLKLSTL